MGLAGPRIELFKEPSPGNDGASKTERARATLFAEVALFAELKTGMPGRPLCEFCEYREWVEVWLEQQHGRQLILAIQLLRL
jgi:hypothetical protein